MYMDRPVPGRFKFLVRFWVVRKSQIFPGTTTGTRVGKSGRAKIRKKLLAGGFGSGPSLFFKLTCGSESCPWEVQKTVSQDSSEQAMAHGLVMSPCSRIRILTNAGHRATSSCWAVVHPAGQWPASISSSSRCAVVGPIGHNR